MIRSQVATVLIVLTGLLVAVGKPRRRGGLMAEHDRYIVVAVAQGRVEGLVERDAPAN